MKKTLMVERSQLHPLFQVEYLREREREKKRERDSKVHYGECGTRVRNFTTTQRIVVSVSGKGKKVARERAIVSVCVYVRESEREGETKCVCRVSAHKTDEISFTPSPLSHRKSGR